MLHVIRRAELSDLPTIAEIEEGNLSPWSLASLENELMVNGGMQHIAESSDGKILGWSAIRVVPPEAELLRIVVADQFRQRGVATGILEFQLAALTGAAIESLFLEVRSLNKPAIFLYERFGFRKTGVRKAYYSEPVDDAVLMELKL